nr:immunoglobulin light chain junction region [Macaca mulatta]MPN79994.1 immunoglobulin light chain junction region [Macaca mulatta]MPN80280.1 immunoglobulin light chain junction region [Macaca mulatta]MPN80507.1 immunoglobulin light chain junction region [Macaca mulatta]MPN80525.1 immunoglobulin light chain junction region [Macaca mulatta]
CSSYEASDTFIF